MNSHEIVVSIICITYNHEKYIKDALESFINQRTNFRFEIIVHDDASTDSTTDIIKGYEQKYPDLIKPIYQKKNQYLKLKSQGKSAVMYCVPLARGRYVATCEGDDYWTDCYKLQKQVDFLEKNPDYVACVHNTRIDDLITPPKLLNCFRVINGSAKAYDITFSDAIKNGNSSIYQCSSFMCKTEHYKTAYSDPRPDFFYKAKGFGDWPLLIYCALAGKIRYIPDIMSVYRYGVEGSYTLNHMNDQTNWIEEQKILIGFTKAVDEYTDFQYSDTIYSVQRIYEFKLALMTNDYTFVRKKENNDLWLKLSRQEKIKFILKCKAPGLYKVYRKLRD